QRDVEVFLDPFDRGAAAHARRVVELLPRVGTVLDEIGDQHSADGAVGHAHAGVAGHDVDVVGIERITPDEGQAVDGLHDLPGPAEFDGTGRRAVFAQPGFDPGKARIGVLRLPGLLIRAAGDHYVDHLVVVATELAIGRALQPDVVIRIPGVPVERRADRAGRGAGADGIRMVRRLFRVNRDEIVERGVGRDD